MRSDHAAADYANLVRRLARSSRMIHLILIVIVVVLFLVVLILLARKFFRGEKTHTESKFILILFIGVPACIIVGLVWGNVPTAKPLCDWVGGVGGWVLCVFVLYALSCLLLCARVLLLVRACLRACVRDCVCVCTRACALAGARVLACLRACVRAGLCVCVCACGVCA